MENAYYIYILQRAGEGGRTPPPPEPHILQGLQVQGEWGDQEEGQKEVTYGQGCLNMKALLAL